MKIITLLFCFFVINHAPALAQTFQWVKSGTSSGLDSQINGLSQGNGVVTATGTFAGNLTFDNQTISSAGQTSVNALTGQWSTQGSLSWLQKSGNPPTAVNTYNLSGRTIASDANGNTYVAYFVLADALFGQSLVQVPSNGQALVVVKYDAPGNLLWVRPFTATSAINLGGIAVDASGNCWLAASFTGRLVSGDVNLASSQLSNFEPDGLLAKIESNGALPWTQQFMASSGNIFTAAGADGYGNVYVAGHFGTAIKFNSTIEFSGTNGGHLFLAKYSASGTCLWARRMGSPNYDIITGVAVDPTGAVASCGSFGNIGTGTGNSTAAFGTASLTTSGNEGLTDGFVAKFDSQGTFAWAQAIHGLADERCDAIAAGKEGSFYVSGRANSGATVGPFAITTGNGSAEGFVAKLGVNGDAAWLTSYGSDGDDLFAGVALAADQQGNVYVGGAFYSAAQFGSLPASGYGNRNVAFIAKLLDTSTVLPTKNTSLSLLTLQAYPNPAHDQVRVSWPIGAHPTALELVDVTGRLLSKSPITNRDVDKLIYLTNVKSGVYLLRLSTVMGPMQQRLVVE